ncbi:hypothetical protein [Ruminococcus sp.]|uniref:hypothetical protein n=1 Tax=Ruminococcus sp. TaxID=41978 RepID=UPI0025F6D834|nr:hypothetical protein [Ruminococcus sp.]MCR4639335.1 hypothetical protein [Ruminococcus sp.]
MEYEEEYKQNRTAMKKLKKEGTMILIIFAGCLAMAVWMLVAFFITQNKMILLSSVLGAAAAVTGFFSAYRKDSALAIAAGVLLLATIAVMFFYDGFSVLGVAELAVFGWFAARNFLNIKKYKWLEQQEGFPQFEPKLREYDMEKAQRNIGDTYAAKTEERQKNSTDSMDEL